MKRQTEEWTDQRMDVVIGSLLRAGVLIAAALVLVGGVVYLARHGGEAPSLQMFRGRPPGPRGIGGILRDAAAPRGRAIVQIGLLVLIATPLARVLFSVYAFWRQRDWLYVSITLIVLTVLAWSLFGGRV